MKYTWLIMILLVLSLSWLALAEDKPEAPKEEQTKPQGKPNEKLTTFSEKLSYAIGIEIGKSLNQLKGKIDLAILIQGLEDSFGGRELLLTPEEAKEIQVKFSREMQAEQARKMKELAQKNKKEGAMFLEENKKKQGVVTTESGLQYMVLVKGDGPKPKATDKISVHYRGQLVDGTEFDSSFKRGKPTTFEANRVIPGWSEGLQLMPVGSKYRFFIPPQLAYGERGTGQLIGPNAVLIFDVELLNIEK